MYDTPGRASVQTLSLDKERRRLVWLWAVIALGVAAVANFLPRGFDYTNFFGPHVIPWHYTPWTDGLLYVLRWPVLLAATILALVVSIHNNGGRPWLILPAIFSLPTIWVLFLGQLDGIALLGMVLMPWAVPVRLMDKTANRGRAWWVVLLLFTATTLAAALVIHQQQGAAYGGVSPILGRQPEVGLATVLLIPWSVPLLLLKPNLTAFALLARRNWFLTGILWIGLSLLIWGAWPVNLLVKITPESKALQPQDVSLFPWSLLVAVPMLWLSRGDPHMLMAGGNFAAPSVMPYHYLVLMPSLARLPLKYAVLCWLSSFLPLTANYFGPAWWLTGNVFPLMIWLGLWHKRRSAHRSVEAMWQAA
jgi:hypothetical protein